MIKYKEPDWKLPSDDSFFGGFKKRGELYSMTLPDWEIAKKYLNQFRNDLDIGGHIGTTALRYCTTFEKVYSFEHLYYDLLSQNLKDVDNLEIFPFALSNKNQKMEMIRRKENSGLTMLCTEENKHYLNKNSYRKEKTLIETRILDDFDLTNLDFIKIDTEGYVLEILKGMENTLYINNYPLLQIEFNNLNPKTEECFNLLNEMGYEIVDKFHVDHFFLRK